MNYRDLLKKYMNISAADCGAYYVNDPNYTTEERRQLDILIDELESE